MFTQKNNDKCAKIMRKIYSRAKDIDNPRIRQVVKQKANTKHHEITGELIN